jgi:hypothetical protein
MNDAPDSPSRSRRDFLLLLATGTVGAAISAQAQAQPRPNAAAALPAGVPSAMTVYKDPDCGCCTEWVKHIRKAGFVVSVRDTRDMSTVKSAMGVPGALQSCHTARVGSYVLEGHVPADLVVKLLQQKPLALGLAVPGMPVGSPGMEGAPPDKYDVMLFDKAGKSRVYASRG